MTMGDNEWGVNQKFLDGWIRSKGSFLFSPNDRCLLLCHLINMDFANWPTFNHFYYFLVSVISSNSRDYPYLWLKRWELTMTVLNQYKLICFLAVKAPEDFTADGNKWLFFTFLQSFNANPIDLIFTFLGCRKYHRVFHKNITAVSDFLRNCCNFRPQSFPQ